jgi:hypothetical protein
MARSITLLSTRNRMIWIIVNNELEWIRFKAVSRYTHNRNEKSHCQNSQWFSDRDSSREPAEYNSKTSPFERICCAIWSGNEYFKLQSGSPLRITITFLGTSPYPCVLFAEEDRKLFSNLQWCWSIPLRCYVPAGAFLSYVKASTVL